MNCSIIFFVVKKTEVEMQYVQYPHDELLKKKLFYLFNNDI